MEAEVQGMMAELAAAAREAGELRAALADAGPRSAVESER